jgi:Mce-associated membrane protein
MSRPTPRRPSRTTTPRPRKIAGRDETPAETSTPARAATTPPAPPKPPRRPVARPPDDSTTPAGPSTGLTSTLLAVVGVLVLMLVLQCGWFVWNSLRDVEVAATQSSTDEEDDNAPIDVPPGRPVVLNQLAVQEGVQVAADAAQVMFARNWENYDKGVDNAVALMTEEFGEEFRATTEDVRQEFVRKKTEVQVRVVAQSVVRANDTELEALVFLNQYVFRGKGEGAESTYTPYRALLTMVHTDAGWLVDGVDTK